MKRSFLKAIGTAAAFAAVMGTGFVVSPQLGRADDRDEGEESKIRIGFAISPVHLNLRGKDRQLVGLGSYIVNAQADCNGCHSSDPATEFVAGGNPYFALEAGLRPGGGSGTARSGEPTPESVVTSMAGFAGARPHPPGRRMAIPAAFR
jgi:hypothetical protein